RNRRRGAVPGVGCLRDRRDFARRRRRTRRPLVTLQETAMPIVTIPMTREGTTPAPKAALIQGATDLLADVLNKPPRLTFVVIQEVEREDGGVGGLPAAAYRRPGHVESRDHACSSSTLSISISAAAGKARASGAPWPAHWAP